MVSEEVYVQATEIEALLADNATYLPPKQQGRDDAEREEDPRPPETRK
jgi:hypothetical protein